MCGARGWGGGAHDGLGEPLELHHVRREHGAPVALDDGHVLADHPEPVGVEDDVHALLLRDVERETRKVLHVRFAAKAGPDDEDMQALEESLELLTDGGFGAAVAGERAGMGEEAERLTRLPGGEGAQ